MIFQANSAFSPFEGAWETGFMDPEKQKDRAGRFPFFSELGYNPYEAEGVLTDYLYYLEGLESWSAPSNPLSDPSTMIDDFERLL